MKTKKSLTNFSKGSYIDGSLIQDVQKHLEPPLYYDRRTESPLAPTPMTRSAVTLTDGTVLYSEYDPKTLRHAYRHESGRRRNGYVAVSDYEQILADAVIAVFPYSAALHDEIEDRDYSVMYAKEAKSIVILPDELCILAEYPPDEIVQALQG